ncbi:MAG: hypothetical protein EBR26_02940, partial [Microbacteriaceae bacterium]|nr:hypothetical protein [Microbacteriaceae bacterium]
AVNSQGFGSASTESSSVEPNPARDGLLSVSVDGFVRSSGVAISNLNRLSTKYSTYLGTVPTTTGKGAWLLATGNRVLNVGDASAQNISFADRAIQMVPSYNGLGFHLIGATGLVYSSTNAPTISATAQRSVVVVGGAASKTGIWLVSASGKVIGLSGAESGSLPNGRYSRVVPRATGEGFWAITTSGAVKSFGDAPDISTLITGKIKDTALAKNGKGFYALMSTGSVISLGDVPAPLVTSVARGAALVNLAPISEVKDLIVNSFSDFHGALDYTKTTSAGQDVYTNGSPVLASIFSQARANHPATFTFSSGDNWGAAPPLSTVFEEMPSVEALNHMGVDASTFGNHEHDRTLSHVNQTIAASNYRWVVSNYSSLNELTASNTNGLKTAPWAIIERGGVKVGVIGLNTPETKEVVFPGNLGQINIGDVLGNNAAGVATKAQVLRAIADARKAGADIVVSLVHEGWAQFNADSGVAEGRLIDIAKILDGSDVILGGHSHLKYGGLVQDKLIAETTNAGALYNKVHVCVDTAKRKTIGTSLEQIAPVIRVTAGTALASTPLSQDAIASITGYKAGLSAKYNVVIGSIADVSPNGGNPAVQRNYETALGSYIADRLREKMGTQIAIINGGGIRDMLPAKTWVPTDTSIVRPSWSSLKAGYTTSNGPWQVTSSGPYTLTVGDVATVLPFGNTAATTSITGAGVWAALENGVSQIATGAGRFPQVSGLKFTFDMSKAANSGRVVEVTLSDGTPIPNSTSVSYTLATNDFMVAGGDGYTMLGGLGKAKTRDVLETLVREAIINDSKNGPVVMTTDGRITRVNG